MTKQLSLKKKLSFAILLSALTTNVVRADDKLPLCRQAVQECSNALDAADLTIKDQAAEITKQDDTIKTLQDQRDNYAKEAAKPRPSRVEWFLYGAASMAVTGFLLGRIK